MSPSPTRKIVNAEETKTFKPLQRGCLPRRLGWLALASVSLAMPVALNAQQTTSPVPNTQQSRPSEDDTSLAQAAEYDTICEPNGNLNYHLNRNANIETRYMGETPVMIAAENGNLCAARILLDRGATIEAVTSSGDTALLLAAKGGLFHMSHAGKEENTEMVRFLLDHHADIHHRDHAGWTALHEAASRWQWEVVRELIQRGATVDERDDSQNTPLCIAAGGVGNYTEGYNSEHNVLETLRVLIAAKADVNGACFMGDTPLSTAVGQCWRKGASGASGVRILLDAGAKIDVSGQNALDSARKNHCDDIIAVLEQVTQNSATQNALLSKAIANKGTAISQEARGDFIQANTFFKAAQSATDLDRAIAQYRAAIDIAPWYANAWYNLSLALEKAGKPDEARDALDFYLKIKPEGPQDQDAIDRQYVLKAQSEMSGKRSDEQAQLTHTADALRAVLENKTMYRFWVALNTSNEPCSGQDFSFSKCFIYDSLNQRDKVGNGHDGTAIGSLASIITENDHADLALGTQHFCFAYDASPKILSQGRYAWFVTDQDLPSDCTQAKGRIFNFNITSPGDGVLGGDRKTHPTAPDTTQIEVVKCADESCTRHDIAVYWYK